MRYIGSGCAISWSVFNLGVECLLFFYQIFTIQNPARMLEFVFKKAEMLRLIDSSGDLNEGNVVVRLKFGNKAGESFPAYITAYCERAINEITTEEIDGCPRPPGCD
jgi:hypothetical protein